jgi:DNA-binding CsgD family transcriptional regulator
MAKKSNFSAGSELSSAPFQRVVRTGMSPAAPYMDPIPFHFDGAWQDDAGLSEILTNAGTALRDAARAAAEAATRARVLAEGLDVLLADLTVADAPVPAPARSAAPQSAGVALSRREREVLALVAQGRTNKAIADALFVSPNTVKTHVTSLLNKLHAETRVQLAAIATRQSRLLFSNEPGLI